MTIPQSSTDSTVPADMAEVLARTRVPEFGTITRNGGLNTRPMASVWLAERGQIVLTTPVAYAAKVYNVRRDGRVALLYSDFTGSGLSDPRTVLVQGIAEAPEVVAAPQDIPEFWQGVLAENPGAAATAADPDYQRRMAWYYWRLPIVVTPIRLHELDPLPVGGASEAELPAEGDDRIGDALRRYPSAVFTTRDGDGHPYAVRAEVGRRDDDAGDGRTLWVRPPAPVHCPPGSASLLWHRHDGASGDMASFQVAGSADGGGTDWSFTPGRVPPALDTTDDAAWIADAESRSTAYLTRHGYPAPTIDWRVITG